MSQEERKKQGPKHYARISTKRRQSLVDLVIDKGYSIGRAAVRLKIKLSTAKMIVKKYRDHGRFFQKKFMTKKAGSKKQLKEMPDQIQLAENWHQQPKIAKAEQESRREQPVVQTPSSSTQGGAGIEIPTPTLCYNTMTYGSFPNCYGFIFPMNQPWMFPSL